MTKDFYKNMLNPMELAQHDDGVGKLPEFTPNREPRSLSVGREARARQLFEIASNPSTEQLKAVADKLRNDNPDLSEEDAKSSAQNHLRNFSAVYDETRRTKLQTREAVAGALGAKSSDEFRAARAQLDQIKTHSRDLEGQRDEMARWFNGAGLKIEPSQDPKLSFGEKADKAAFDLGVQIAKAGRHTGGEGQQLKRDINETERVIKDRFNREKARAESISAAGLRLGREGLKKSVQTLTGEAKKAGVLINKAFEAIEDKSLGGVEKSNSLFSRLWKGTKDLNAKVNTSIDQKVDKWYDSLIENYKKVDEKVVKKIVNKAKENWDRVKSPVKSAWAAIERERPVVRDQSSLLVGKIGLLVEENVDKARPVLASIADSVSNIADKLVGNKLRWAGLQARKAQFAIGEKISPGIDAIKVKSLEGLILAGNARKGLGEFLSKMGSKFKFREKTHNGVDDLFLIEKQPGLRERVGGWIKERREDVSRLFEKIEKWKLYEAISSWKESGLSNKDISRREKVMRAISAASLARAAAVAGAIAVEGGSQAVRFAKDHKGISAAVFVGAAAVAYLALGQPDFAQSISQIVDGVTNISGGGVDASIVSGVDFQSPSMPESVFKPDVGNIGGAVPDISTAEPVTIQGQPPIGTEDSLASSQFSATSAPNVGTSGSDLPQSNTEQPIQGQAQVGLEDRFESTQAPLATGGISPEPNIPFESIQRGYPVYPQAEAIANTLPGGATIENVTNVMEKIYSQFQVDFEASARAIVNNPESYSQSIVDTARQQLDAIEQMKQNPSSVQYDRLLRAMHYWSQ